MLVSVTSTQLARGVSTEEFILQLSDNQVTGVNRGGASGTTRLCLCAAAPTERSGHRRAVRIGQCKLVCRPGPRANSFTSEALDEVAHSGGLDGDTTKWMGGHSAKIQEGTNVRPFS